MSKGKRLRYRRQINNLKYLHEEKEIVEEILEDAHLEFSEYYNKFLSDRNLVLEPLVEESERDATTSVALKKRASDGGGREFVNDEMGNWIDTSPLEPEKADEVHEVFRKIYRALALHLHPDRLSPSMSEKQKELHLKKFKTAKSALEDKHYYNLIILAEQYDIEIPEMSGKQSEWIEREIRSMSHKIQNLQGSYSFLFSNCETEDQRENLIKQFIMQKYDMRL